MKNFTKVLVVTLLLVLVIGIQSVNATPMLRFTHDSNPSFTVADGSLYDSDSTLGIVKFDGPIGNFDAFGLSTGFTKDAYGTASDPKMDLFSGYMSSSDAGTIKIEFTETDFIASTELLNFYSEAGGTTNGQVSFSFFLDTLNNPFGTDTSGSAILLAESTGFFDAQLTSLMPMEPYSLTIVAEITHGRAPYLLTTFDALIEIPEPATLILLGSGLIGAAVYSRRKKVS